MTTAGTLDRDLNLADFPQQGYGYFSTPEGYVFDFGLVVPVDGTEGYAPGAFFVHTDGSGAATLWYVNHGTKASSNFNPMALPNDDAFDIGTLTVDSIVTDVEAAEHGAGAIGTSPFGAPKTYRYMQNGSIITEIKIDLTGLDSSGTENDVIGLAAGGAAYLGRNVVATNGIIYKIEMSCLEIPLTGDADVILVAGSAADEAFDDTVANTAALCDGTGDWGLGETIVNNAPAALAANYYLYLTQGATDNAAYTAGQFLIRLYGHPVLT